MTEIQKTPKNVQPNLEERQFDFEKYKAKIELFKWAIVSVVLVAITMVN
jgi:hypothetical protein